VLLSSLLVCGLLQNHKGGLPARGTGPYRWGAGCASGIVGGCPAAAAGAGVWLFPALLTASGNGWLVT
jgi:hypothetical protein